ncbi:MAG: putative maltokinase, partial [Chloroflexota bacterium]|nr:putative maltokinase [Chloroflexota bacterium]
RRGIANMSDNGNFAPMHSWEEVFQEENRAALEKLLPGYLMKVRWFGGKARQIESVAFTSTIPLPTEQLKPYIANIRVSYADGGSQTYVLPLGFAQGKRGEQIERDSPQAVIARFEVGGTEGMLYDASQDKAFASLLLDSIRKGETFGDDECSLLAWPTAALSYVLGDGSEQVEPKIMKAQQSNTSIAYGGRAILKMFRRLEEGTSPDLEIGRFLGERGFEHTPPLAGALEFKTQDNDEPLTLAILQGFVSNQGDAWEYTLDSLEGYFDRAASTDNTPQSPLGGHLLEMLGQEVPAPVSEALGSYLDSARLLGRRTAEMHLALASGEDDPAFGPEPFTREYMRSRYQSVSGLVEQAFGLLANKAPDLPDETRSQAREVIQGREEILARFEEMLQGQIEAVRTRVHGDYHLGQVLWTGSDFVIIDFEGEPVRSLKERREKHSPLKDVTGMLRSFHYAAYAAMFSRVTKDVVASESQAGIEGWAEAWHKWVSVAYLQEYLEVAATGNFLPRNPQDLRTLFDIYLLEKAVYELIYELNNRPEWVRIPLQGVRDLIG